MGEIKKKIRNLKYGTEICSVLAENEHLTFQNVISCSTNNGKLWCTAVVGLTDKRLIIEWQRNKGKNIALPYEQLKSWRVHNELGGLGGHFVKKAVCVDICVNEQLTIRIAGKKSITEIFINQLEQYLNKQ